jgi:hypothetical protein
MNATVHSRLTPSLFSGRTEWNAAFNAAVTIGLSVLLISSADHSRCCET